MPCVLICSAITVVHLWHDSFYLLCYWALCYFPRPVWMGGTLLATLFGFCWKKCKMMLFVIQETKFSFYNHKSCHSGKVWTWMLHSDAPWIQKIERPSLAIDMPSFVANRFTHKFLLKFVIVVPTSKLFADQKKFGKFVSQKFRKIALRNFEDWLVHICYILHSEHHCLL